MEWNAEHTIATVSSIAAIFAAVAAWFSYLSSKATLQALYNKERPILNVEAKITRDHAGIPCNARLYIENFGASFAIFEKVELEYEGTRYDAAKESAIELLQEILDTKYKGKYEILQLIDKWRIGCNISKNLIVATPDDLNDLEQILNVLYKINVKVTHIDCHGVRTEE